MRKEDRVLRLRPLRGEENRLVHHRITGQGHNATVKHRIQRITVALRPIGQPVEQVKTNLFPVPIPFPKYIKQPLTLSFYYFIREVLGKAQYTIPI